MDNSISKTGKSAGTADLLRRPNPESSESPVPLPSASGGRGFGELFRSDVVTIIYTAAAGPPSGYPGASGLRPPPSGFSDVSFFFVFAYTILLHRSVMRRGSVVRKKIY